jgi:hypothetical protein
LVSPLFFFSCVSKVADKEYSSCQTLESNGSFYTDFDKLGFTVTTQAGRTVGIYADRCGDPSGGGSDTIHP